MLIGGYDEAEIEKRGTKRGATEVDILSKSDDGIFWMYINSNFYWMVDLYEAFVGE